MPKNQIDKGIYYRRDKMLDLIVGGLVTAVVVGVITFYPPILMIAVFAGIVYMLASR